ncbi:hypothetical protein [Luteibacter sp. CQ10]|uniref:hypothetical protein n=1 Tax=Luteibacter sp. CQ10 TaxID=2805821 RepID=UPI0034A26A60
MPHARFPRVVGFEVPALDDAGSTSASAPLVALLDVAPTANWTAVFDRETPAFQRAHGIGAITVEADRIVVSGMVGNPREVTRAIRDLVERVTQIRQAERLGESGPHRL